MKWFILYLSRWKDYKGRSRRKEFLFANIFRNILWIPLTFDNETVSVLCVVAWSILFDVPLIVRRLHDTNKSAWWLATIFLPYIFIFFKSDEGDNRFGKNPITKNENFKDLVNHFHS